MWLVGTIVLFPSDLCVHAKIIESTYVEYRRFWVL